MTSTQLPGTPVPPSTDESNPQTERSIGLITLVVLAVLFQFSIAICLCIISCNSSKTSAIGEENGANDNVEDGEPEVTSASAENISNFFDTVRCPRRLTTFYNRMLSSHNFRWFRRRDPMSNRPDDGGSGNRTTASTAAYTEPPPPYDEALTMPRTTSGHVVLFFAGDNCNECSERIVFRFTMTDDPTGLPPSFADAVVASGGGGNQRNVAPS